MRYLPSVTCLTLLLAASGTVTAQKRSPVEAAVGLELVTSGIESVVADSAGIGSRAYGFLIPASVTAFRVLSLSADLGVIGMSDERAFTQQTNLGEKTSEVTALTWSVSAGLRTPPISLGGEKPRHLSAGVSAGRNFVNVHRSIANCSNCQSQDLEVNAGDFLEGLVQVGAGSGAVTGRYRAYRGDSDLRDALVIGYSMPLRSRPKPAEAPTEPAAP